MRFLATSVVGLVMTASFVLAPMARAQVDPADIAYETSVSRRPLETKDIGSARIGAWELTPLLTVGLTHDDNIFATPRFEVDDLITTIVPVVRLASDWNRHQTAFEVGGDFGLYQDNTNEDYTDYYIDNGTVLDVTHGTRLLLDLRYAHRHEPRTSSESRAASESPTEYDQRFAGLGIKRDIGIFTLGVNGSVDRLTYSSGKSIGGRTIDNSDRDRTVSNYGLGLGYEPFPETTASLDVGYRDVDYDDSTVNGGPNRDSSGVAVDLGLNKVISDLWVLDFGIGYSPRDFKDGSLTDITGGNAITLRADLLWNPTAITSVQGTLSRQTYETTQAGTSAIVSTFAALSAEHQLMRSLFVDAGLDYDFSDYDGVRREDQNYGISLGLEYHLTRYVSVRADYSYRERDSNENLNDYAKNLAQIALRLSL